MITRRALGLSAVTLATPAIGQTAPVKLVLPVAPGGSIDVTGRILAGPLGEALGRQVVIENRGGGGGLIATDAVVGAPPDGNTFAYFSVSAAVMNAGLHRNLRYDLRQALVPVSLVGTMPMLAVCGKHVPAENLAEFLALLRREPGRRTYGSAGPGSINHLGGLLLATRGGATAEHIAYRGAGPVIAEMIAGNVDYLVEGVASLHPYVRSGALRGLAVTSSTRSALLPDVPTASEAGLPGFEILNWFALFAPAGTPPAVIEKVQDATRAALRQAAVAQRFRDNGVEPVGSTAAELASFRDQQFDLWLPVIRASGATAD